MENNLREKKSFYSAEKAHFKIEEYSTDAPQSMPNYHYHDKYELYYLRRGERYYFIKDNTYVVHPGAFVLIDKNEIHCTGTLNNAGYDRVLIYFDDHFFESVTDADGRDELLSCFKRNLGVVEISPEKRALAEMLLDSMLTEFKDGNGKQDLCVRAALIQLLCLISKESERNATDKESELKAPQKTTSKIIGYINNNYFEDITLDMLSKRFYISPYYLSRTLKKVYGISFVEYLNNVRVKEAKRLLVSTKMSITEICTAVGYKSITHFGRIFKKITAYSPLEYRKGHRLQK